MEKLIKKAKKNIIPVRSMIKRKRAADEEVSNLGLMESDIKPHFEEIQAKLRSLDKEIQDEVKKVLANAFEGAFSNFDQPEGANNGAGHVLFDVEDFDDLYDDYVTLPVSHRVRWINMFYDLNLITSPANVGVDAEDS